MSLCAFVVDARTGEGGGRYSGCYAAGSVLRVGPDGRGRTEVFVGLRLCLCVSVYERVCNLMHY